MKFVTIERIISKIYRDIGDTGLGESDLIEWAGEALEFLRVPALQEEALAFINVHKFHAPVPQHFHNVIQMARYNGPVISYPEQMMKEIGIQKCRCSDELNDELEENKRLTERPFFTFQCGFKDFSHSGFYHNHLTPITLSDNTFFKSSTDCDESVPGIFIGNTDSYTIVGGFGNDQLFRFSFPEGNVVVSYYRNALDKETGYPLIPDEIRCTTAIEYYIQWKVAEKKAWEGREGFHQIAGEKYQLWNKYCKQAKDDLKMPQSLDEYNNLLNDRFRMIPEESSRYYSFFGNFKIVGNHGGRK